MVKNVKFIGTIFLTIMLSALFVNAYSQNGLIGTLEWKLEQNGVLTFSGTGEMKDYKLLSTTPWNKYKDQTKKVVIEEGVTNIGKYSFSGFTSLQSVSISNTVTRIGSNAFYECTSLTSLTIPDNVTSIENDAFYKCANLKTLSLGKSVEKLGGSIIMGCDNLQTLICNNITPPTITSKLLSDTFLGAPFTSCKLIVPEDSKTAYMQTKGWNKFTNISVAGANVLVKNENVQQALATGSQTAVANNVPNLPQGAVLRDGFIYYEYSYHDQNVKKVYLNGYDTDYKFSDGMLAVKNTETNKWGFINDKGDVVIDYEWQSSLNQTPRFGGGACAVFKMISQYGRQWYVIDKTGKSVKFPTSVTSFSDFSQDGYAIAMEKIGNSYKRYYIDNTGKRIFPNLDEETYASGDLRIPRPFKNGLAAYYNYNKKLYGFINESGKIVIQPQFIQAFDFSDGLAAVLQPGSGTTAARWGYVDPSGKMAIEAKFSQQVLSFYDGYAAVQKTDGKVVFIDKQGNVASPEYLDARQFHNGFAFVKTTEGKVQVVNTKFELVRSGYNNQNYNQSIFAIKFPSRGLLDSFKELNYVGDYLIMKADYATRLYTSDGRPHSIVESDYVINNFYGKLAHAKFGKKDGFIDFERGIVYVILFEKPEF